MPFPHASFHCAAGSVTTIPYPSQWSNQSSSSSQRSKKNLPDGSVRVTTLRMTSELRRWSKFTGAYVTNKQTSIPGTGLPVTASVTVPEIPGVPTRKGDSHSKNTKTRPGASCHKRKKTTSTKTKYGHHANFDLGFGGSKVAMPH